MNRGMYELMSKALKKLLNHEKNIQCDLIITLSASAIADSLVEKLVVWACHI